MTLGGDKDAPFLSDDTGRDLVSQHLINYSKNTYNHFKTLSNLFTRLKIVPHDSYDQSGYNAFHYLAAFDPLELANKLATDKEERAKDKAKQEKACRSSESDGGNSEENEEDSDGMEVDEEESKKDGAPKMTKKEKRAQAKYQDVKKQMLEMAQTLERWGYKWDSVAIDGNTPLALAV